MSKINKMGRMYVATREGPADSVDNGETPWTTPWPLQYVYVQYSTVLSEMINGPPMLNGPDL